ncbi:hypothetical protein Adt_05743 [Abeliophyllum distichum]|uniref:Uncharacterized protein n=1 Tax=Abeliophyllum distichum TaxID=126358 RepID=A0ABD1V4Y5_9LAMI
MMKDNIRGTGLVKKVMAKLASKSMALKGKIRDIETRLIIFYLLRDKKVLSLGSNVSHKLKHHCQQEKFLNQTNAVDSNTIIILDNNFVTSAETREQEEEEHMNNVLDDVNKKEERDGEEFRLEENDIDQKADLFIQQFHHQMRLQRLNS